VDWWSHNVHSRKMDRIKKNSEILQKLAEEIKALRAEKGLSQEALALTADVDRSYVSHLERGVANPTVDILQRIAVALGTNVRLTLSREPD
jgi:transcriptional regulator with XRE-family HTH domain